MPPTRAKGTLRITRRLAHPAEGQEEQQEDDRQGRRDDDHQPARCPLGRSRVLAPPRSSRPAASPPRPSSAALRPRSCPRRARGRSSGRRGASLALVGDGLRPLHGPDVGDARERHLLAARRGEEELAEALRVTAHLVRKRTTTSKRRGPSRISCGRGSADRRLHELAHVRDVQAVSGDPRTVDVDLDLGGAGEHLHLQVGRAPHFVEDGPDSPSTRSSVAGSGPKTLTATSALTPETTSSRRMAMGWVKL